MVQRIPLVIVLLSIAYSCRGQGWVCAEGGGISDSGPWTDEVFGWMVEKGNRGPVVLIGAVPLERDSRPATFERLGAKSARSLVVTQENADSREVYDTIASASVVFIRGGDQGRYVGWWKGTKTEEAIHAVYKKGGVVGGTSAGCAVLGGVTYDALKNSLLPLQILADARHENLSLTKRFLGLVPGVIFDTHFSERGRLPRLAVFLAAAKQDYATTIIGLGVDPRTAVCVGPDGMGHVLGEGTVTMLSLTSGSRWELNAGAPPVVTDVSYTQLSAGHSIDMKSGDVVGKPTGLEQRPRASVQREIGDGWSVRGGVSEDESQGVRFVMPPGPGERGFVLSPVAEQPIAGMVLATQAWSERATQANHLGLVRALAEDVYGAAWLDEGSRLRAEKNTLFIETGGNTPARSVVVLVKRPGTTVSMSSEDDRRTVVEGAMLHVLAPGWKIDSGGRAEKRASAAGDGVPPAKK